MIEIKTTFSGWKEVDKERALKYILFLKSSTPAIKSSDKIQYIETYALRGIKVLELCPDYMER